MKGLAVLHNSGEHMNDDELVDHAEQFHQDLSLLQHQQKTAIAPDAVSAEWCESCGNEIPEQRRKSIPGVTLCVDCKRENERKDRLYR
ncbi:TraR/DksA C4-type zinc finger protein [Methylobacter tundripaludum]|uniref:TraR/DksA C4-type zinc finger protein n=1 Tax=Methylobacter tundripaludum TaxID=173365 RepID=UPI000A49C95B|nr:TraR/DksA C4-type zinc finger protein [Methylobacter tundripaludum]